MDENRKNTIEVEMTEDDWMELLQVCIDLRVTPDTLIECFCWEVIRQQSLLRIVADAIRRDAVTRSAKYPGVHHYHSESCVSWYPHPVQRLRYPHQQDRCNREVHLQRSRQLLLQGGGSRRDSSHCG